MVGEYNLYCLVKSSIMSRTHISASPKSILGPDRLYISWRSPSIWVVSQVNFWKDPLCGSSVRPILRWKPRASQASLSFRIIVCSRVNKNNLPPKGDRSDGFHSIFLVFLCDSGRFFFTIIVLISWDGGGMVQDIFRIIFQPPALKMLIFTAPQN